MKRIISLVICIALILTLCSCGHSSAKKDKSKSATLVPPNGAVDTTDIAEPEANPIKAPEPTETTEPVMTDDPIVETQTIDFDLESAADPLERLIVSKSFAQNFGGAYVLRNGKTYSLSDGIPLDVSREYEIGWRRGYTDGALKYYSGGKGVYLTFGDVPLLTLAEGDVVISYNNTLLRLRRAELVGYTICVWPDGNNMALVSDYDSLNATAVDAKSFIVLDQNGKSMTDYRNLNYGETYVVSWFTGTQYNEIEMSANCKSFRVEQPTTSWDYEFEGQITRDGYATYDLSELPSGVYYISAQGGNGGVAKTGFIEIP